MILGGKYRIIKVIKNSFRHLSMPRNASAKGGALGKGRNTRQAASFPKGHDRIYHYSDWLETAGNTLYAYEYAGLVQFKY